MWILLGALALGALRWRIGGSWQRWLAGAALLALCGFGLPFAWRRLHPPRDPHTAHWDSCTSSRCASRRGCWAKARAVSQRVHGLDYGSLSELSENDLIDEVLSGGVKKGYVFEVAPSPPSSEPQEGGR